MMNMKNYFISATIKKYLQKRNAVYPSSRTVYHVGGRVKVNQGN